MDLSLRYAERKHDLELILHLHRLCRGLSFLCCKFCDIVSCLCLRGCWRGSSSTVSLALSVSSDNFVHRTTLKLWTKHLYLSNKLVCASLNRHTGTVEAHRERRFFALHPSKSR